MTKSISPLEIVRLPRLKFEGRVAVVNVPEDEQRIQTWFAGEHLLGFDTESRPSRTSDNPIAIVQLATEQAACIWRISERRAVPPLLRSLLEDSAVHKVGQGVGLEIGPLQNLGLGPRSFIDLHAIALRLRVHPCSLQGLVALFMQRQLGKEQRLTDWEQVPLTAAQIEYAALDAWVSRQVLLAMRQAYAAERLEGERLLPGPTLGLARLQVSEPPTQAASKNEGARGDKPQSSSASFTPPEKQEEEEEAVQGTRSSRRDAQQRLMTLCIERGLMLRFDGFESAPGGFRCGFKVEFGDRGRRVTEVFKSKRVHTSITAAQSDAAAEALARLEGGSFPLPVVGV